jgi:hypothetical protein
MITSEWVESGPKAGDMHILIHRSSSPNFENPLQRRGARRRVRRCQPEALYRSRQVVGMPQKEA